MLSMDGTLRRAKNSNWYTYNMLDIKLPTSPPGYDELGKGKLKSINPKYSFTKDNVNLDECANWCNEDKKCTGFSWGGYSNRKCLKVRGTLIK
jgi:hypothetical protein